MPEARLVLEIEHTDSELVDRIHLSAAFESGHEYQVANALMEEMRNKIKISHNRELAGIGGNTA